MTHTHMKLHPKIQKAIDLRGNANVDGDHYNATLKALAALGYTESKRLSFKDPSITGVEYRNGTQSVHVTVADFLGAFTDIQFK